MEDLKEAKATIKKALCEQTKRYKVTTVDQQPEWRVEYNTRAARLAGYLSKIHELEAVAKIYRNAIAFYEHHDWLQGSLRISSTDGLTVYSACIVGALGVGSKYEFDAEPFNRACRWFEDTLPPGMPVETWNDTVCQSKAQAVQKLHQVLTIVEESIIAMADAGLEESDVNQPKNY